MWRFKFRRSKSNFWHCWRSLCCIKPCSNTTVTYSLSGTATFGVDYTIDGATSEGGSIVIQNVEGTEAPDNLADNEDIVVTLLSDSVEDIDETIIITLTGVSSPDGEIALGRPNNDGGLLTATIIIGDVTP